MKPIFPHDPLDELIAAALHGELSGEERSEFESRLQNDPAARAAYQEAQVMHDLLEKTHQDAQPDPAFEERMVSGFRRKIHQESPRESAWESLVFLWLWVKRSLSIRHRSVYVQVAVAGFVILLVVGVVWVPVTNGLKSEGASMVDFRTRNIGSRVQIFDGQTVVSGGIWQASNGQAVGSFQQSDGTTVQPVIPSTTLQLGNGQVAGSFQSNDGTTVQPVTPPGVSSTFWSATEGSSDQKSASTDVSKSLSHSQQDLKKVIEDQKTNYVENGKKGITLSGYVDANSTYPFAGAAQPQDHADAGRPTVSVDLSRMPDALSTHPILQVGRQRQFVELPQDTSSLQEQSKNAATRDKTFRVPAVSPAVPSSVPSEPSLKLIRNAQLDLEVKSFQSAMDQIGALTKAAVGYVDSSHSEKGGNGKLQGTVVVKVLPENLDAFLLKLRDVGQVENQSVSAENVTKDYYDTQARLDNSRRMEVQLQDLLKHENSKVSDLLQVERELGRVRGDIEQMQGQLKLYDFEVQYATVTIQMKEKDLNQAAAYLLREQDDFSLFAVDVEATFKRARAAADEFKAQVLQANLHHNSGSDISADLVVTVAPDQIEPFLSEVRSLGRLDNFTRQTQRVAKDGGDSDQPADETRTEKDNVQVHVAIRSDDESRKQAALTVVTPAVDGALDKAKAAVLALGGAEILSSSLNRTPQGDATAQLSVRVPGKNYRGLLEAFRALGRASSFSLQRDDNSGPGASGDDAPVIVSLSLTDDETPLQQTEMSVVVTDVEDRAQAIKKEAGTEGIDVKDSTFERQPDGTETAQLRFRLPLSKYPAFLQSIKTMGKVESLTVQRQDRPAQTATDEDAPVEIGLRIHNQGVLVPDNTGMWATIRQTFGEGAGALFASVKTIGVTVAFVTPWLLTLGLFAWAGRRIYVRKKR